MVWRYSQFLWTTKRDARDAMKVYIVPSSAVQ